MMNDIRLPTPSQFRVLADSIVNDLIFLTQEEHDDSILASQVYTTWMHITAVHSLIYPRDDDALSP